MLAATLLSLGAVFLAELGDRSQLITMTYTLRYRWWVVLTGVAIAAFTVHGVAVAIGHFGLDRAGPAGRLRIGDRIPDLCRVGLAGGHGQRQRNLANRCRTPTRAVHRGLVVRTG